MKPLTILLVCDHLTYALKRHNTPAIARLHRPVTTATSQGCVAATMVTVPTSALNKVKDKNHCPPCWRSRESAVTVKKQPMIPHATAASSRREVFNSSGDAYPAAMIQRHSAPAKLIWG